MKNIYLKIQIILVTFLVTLFGSAQSTETFISSTTWTVPAGVTSIVVKCWGGGGAGGGDNANNVKGGGGGAGGSYATKTLTVSPGQTYNLTVGTGAVGSEGNGSAGGNTTFTGTGGTVVAQGGAGGAKPNGGNVAGGTGSITACNPNALPSLAGANGDGGTSGLGGAGGAGANGGGAGGASRNTSGFGNAGLAPGGGGGGSFIGDNTDQSGGNGARGEITIAYTALPPCESATTLACGTTNQAGTTIGSAAVAHNTGCSMSNYGVWYTFIGDGQQTTISTNPGTYDIKLSVSTATSCAGPFTNVACTDASPESATFTTTVGTKYYVYIAHTSSTSTVTGNFTISRTCCTAPTVAAAGSDQYLANCVSSATLAANVPAAGAGTGSWTCTSGCTGVTITNPALNNTTVTLPASGPSSTFRWTISNTCGTTIDDVIIYYGCTPTNNTCALATTISCPTTNLAGTTIGTTDLADGTPCDISNYGVWYKFVGDGLTNIISVATTTYDVELSISSGSCGTFTNLYCGDAAGSSGTETYTFTATLGVNYYIYVAHYSDFSSATGTFTISRACCSPPTVSNAGPDIMGTSNSATLAANAAISGTGTWTCVSGCTGITISDANSPTATINGIANGTSTVLRWTIANACSSSADNVIITNTTGIPGNQLCSGAINLPCGTTNLAGTTVGTANIANNQTCSMSNYGVWYTFVGDGNVNTISTNPNFDIKLSVNSGTCGAMTNIACTDASPETATFLTTVGVTYYVYVAYWTTGSTTGTFTISRQCISCASGLGAGNVNVTLPYSGAGLTTVGAGDELTSSNTPSCGSSSYFSGQDKLFIFTPTTSGNITVTMSSGSQGGAIKLYNGCPFTSTCVAFDQGTGTGVKTFCTYVTANTEYYLVVDSYDLYSESLASFTLDITTPAVGAANELPCNAVTLVNGSSVAGDNRCTNSAGEPGVPPCWTTGNMNTVWYKFQASSSSMYLRTTLTTIPSTQIAVYSGPAICGTLTFLACNEDAAATGCSGSVTQNSILDLTGLTINNWYWVRVDGDNNDQGTFNISLNDGVSIATTDAVLGQDCSNPVPICSNVQSVANPSYAGTGNICDFTGTNNCTSGEKNSVWYSFEIATTGSLNFTIYPNDATNNSNGAETDYDWVLWKISNADGSTNTSCATLNSAQPAECNYGSPGITGISPTGNAPAGVNSYFDITFEPTVAVTAGERYVLVVQNFETTASGFNLDFSTSTAGAIDGTPSTIFWSGGANTNFNDAANYGACSGVPACGINVVVSNGATQPTITGTNNQVKDLTINPGATLTMAASSKLQICGNLVNNGTLICPPSSTIEFIDGTNTIQSISGNLSGNTNNKFGNLVVTKAAGSVTANVNITIGGNFTTTNSTSIFNSNNKYIKLAGHFTNNNGNSTFTNTGTLGTLEFNGIGQQNYNQGSTQLDLNFVTLNNSAAVGSGVNLLTNMFIKATTGNLTLNTGTITTSGTSVTTGFKVHVLNTTPSCVSVGNVSSFVDGNLRRYVTTSGDYNWPLGNVAKGYQRAQTIFSVTTGMVYIDSRFDSWPSNPPFTQDLGDCGAIFDQESENNGYWTMIPDAGTCTYDCTLYPLNATNTAGMGSWTIIKRPHTSAIDNTGWIFNGTCAASTSTVVTRTGMANFSFLAVDQSLTVLPISLVYFDGYSQDNVNILNWETSSERDNDFFTIEKSADGIHFSDMKQVDGAGNSSSKIVYETTDYSPFNGLTYYRLGQTDFNGEFMHFKTISIENSNSEFKLSAVHPNPTTGNINLEVESPQKGIILYTLFDNAGRVIISQEANVSKGENYIFIDLNDAAKGSYILEIKLLNTDIKQIEKIIKQ